MSHIHKIDWLVDPELPSAEIGVTDIKIPYPYPAEFATGYSEHIEFYDGIVIIKDFHHFKKAGSPSEISLGKFNVKFSSPTFWAHMVHSGHLNLADQNNRIHSRAPGVDMFGRMQSGVLEQTLLTDEDISLSALLIPESLLLNLLGPESAQILFESLNLQQMGDFNEMKVPQSISKKIEGCALSNFNGKMRSLYGHSIVLQYLFELNLYLTSSTDFIGGLENIGFNVEQLHHELLQINADIPSLHDLARKYNVSPGKLNKAFIGKYGESIYSFLSNQRLEQAYLALVNSDIPIKVLAYRIGYAHANHFITAFKKKFGKTPGSIRGKQS